MLKKLFSRKKESPKSHSRQEPPKVQAPDSPEKTLSQVNQAQGKAKAQALIKLATHIEKGEISVSAASAELSGIDRLMIAIAFDEAPESVSQSQWQQLVVDGFTAKIRKTAAAQITDHGILSDLVKQTKGKDKAVYRILQETLDAQNTEQKEAEEWAGKKHAVLSSLQKLAESPLEPMYEAKLKGLIEQWKELNVSEATDNTAFEQAKNTAQLKIDAASAQQAAQKAQAERVELADDNRQQLIDQLTGRLLERVSTLDVSEHTLSEDQHFLTDIQHQWREIEQASRASKDEQRQFQRASTAFEVGLPRLNRLLEKHGDMPTILATLHDEKNDNEVLLHDIDDWLHEIEFALALSVPDTVVKLQQALKNYQQSLADHRQQEIDRIRGIRAQLRRCLQAVEEGSLRRASGLYHGVEEKLEGFDLTHHAGIRKQLEETTEALEKLRDWQSYAVLPKKEALIKRMTALVDQSIDPESRAQAIREMQDEWKLLSRGLQNRQQDLWETFHDLAQKAYEPCKEYFSEQRHLREINLDRRKDIVAQLTQYRDILNWDAPDIKEIDRVLQVARNDWRHYSPVDRVANKPVQAEFDRVHQDIFNRLRQEQDVFKQRKLDIIEQAKTLLELEDVKDATEKAKQLQRDWKAAGTVARKDEQQLWKAFREVCDELFARREQQVNEFKADLEEHRVKAEEIIVSLEALSSSTDVLAEQSVFENLKAQYDQVGTLPKAHYSKLSGRYRVACQAFDEQCKKAKSVAADQHWIDVINWVKSARYDGHSMDELKSSWSALRVPDEASALIEQVDTWLAPVDELNLAAMHEKTIDLEILTESESPAEDSDIRMNLQVQRLSEGIGARPSDHDVHTMVVEWLAIGAVDKPDYERFETRMKAARNHWLK